jgi:hypothetical protein
LFSLKFQVLHLNNRNLSGVGVKLLALFLPVLIICIVVFLVLRHFGRFPWIRTNYLPVGVTALSATAAELEAPLTAELLSSQDLDAAGYTSLYDFTDSVYNGQSGQVVGVYAPGLFALPVRQQPDGQPDFVDRENNILTEFSLPKKYGSTGLLAHNYLSGSRFSRLKENQDVVLIYGDGKQEHYRISKTVSYQALKPNSPFSDFVDNSNPNEGKLTSADLFNRVYTTRHQLVFQTCIEANGEPSWGRVFIIASLIEPLHLNIPSLVTITNSN